MESAMEVVDASAPNEVESSQVEQSSNEKSAEKEAEPQPESSGKEAKHQPESSGKEAKPQPESSGKEAEPQPESSGKEAEPQNPYLMIQDPFPASSGDEAELQPESSEKESTSQKLPSLEKKEGKKKSKALEMNKELLSECTKLAASILKRDLASKNSPASKKQCLDYNSMSAGVYLDSTVVPILHASLINLARIRPADPVQFVIDYLLCHKEKFSKIEEKPEPSVSSTHQA